MSSKIFNNNIQNNPSPIRFEAVQGRYRLPKAFRRGSTPRKAAEAARDPFKNHANRQKMSTQKMLSKRATIGFNARITISAEKAALARLIG